LNRLKWVIIYYWTAKVEYINGWKVVLWQEN